MNAIVSVVGKNTVGILAAVSSECAKYNANIVDVSQTIINEYFTMFMIVNIEKLSVSFIEFVDILTELGKEKNLEIHAMHEDIFNLMHKI
jgi:ACT domain-containing protein